MYCLPPCVMVSRQVTHAMALRAKYHRLLPPENHDDQDSRTQEGRDADHR